MATLRLAIDAREAKTGADSFNSELKRITGFSREAVGSTEKLSKSIDKTGKEAAQTGRQLTEAGNATREAGRKAVRAEREFRGFRRELRSTNERAANFAGTMVRLGAGITGIVALRGGIGVLRDFELTMAQVGGVTRATEQQFRDLTDTARELGASTVFSAKEAADGLLFLSRAGFSTSAAMAAIPDTLNLAQAGSLELGEAADFASNILSQFGLQAEETVRVVDTLIGVSNRSNTDVRQLAEALKYAGPVAGALGITVEETAAAIGVLGDSGIQASLAGTNLRGIMAGLLGPTEEAQKAIESYGLSVQDVNPAMNDLVTIFQRFRDVGLDPAEAETIFGRRNVGAALTLTKAAANLETLRTEAELADGEAENLARTMNNTLNGALRSLVSVAQELVLQLGEYGLTDALKSALGFMTDVLRVIGGIEDETGPASEGFQLLARSIQFAAVSVGTFLAVDIAAGLVNIALRARQAAFAVGTLGAVMKLNPYVLAISAIAGVVSVMESLNNEVEEQVRQVENLGASYRAFESQFKTVSRIRAEFDEALEGGTVREQAEALDRYADSIRRVQKELQVATREAQNRSKDPAQFLQDVESGRFTTGISAEDIAASTGIALDKVRTFNKERLREIDEARRGTRELIEALTVPGDSFGEPVFTDDPEYLRFLSTFPEVAIPGYEEVVERAKKDLKELEALRENLGSGNIPIPELEKLLQQQLDNVEGLRVKLGLDIAEDEADEFKKKVEDLVGGGSDETRRINSNSTLEDLRLRTSLIGKTQELFEREMFLYEARQGAIRDGIIDLDRYTEEVGRLYDTLARADRFAQIGEQIGSEFGDALFSIITDLDDLEAAFENFARRVGEILFQELVTRRLAASLGGFFSGLVAGPATGTTAVDPGRRYESFVPTANSARGGIVDSGGITTFSMGGVVDRPTRFRAGLQHGLLGEAGKEFIVPAQLMADGSLGLRATGDMGGGGTTVNMTVYAKDASSFRKSARQITAELRKGVK